jgi:ribosome-associated protein
MDHQLPDLEPEISYKTSRSGGKGGQNVNKVSTKVELNFDIAASLLLSENQKAILLSKLNEKLTKEGMLQFISQSERTQLGNKKVALEKFYNVLNACFIVQKKRKPTKVSKAVKERRLLAKKRNAEIKKLRNYKL